MTPLWTGEEIAAATGGTLSAGFQASGVAYDSREVGSGDFFVALKGEASDGHRFVDQAFAQGAPACLVSQPVNGPHVLVADTAKALDDMARASRARSNAQIIGVTGSAGKTGTKEALFAALDRASGGWAHRSVKSYNNHVGVPLSLSRMPREAEYGVLEMGMNHEGELAMLTRIVRPHVAIVTTIAPAHIGYFDDEAHIARAKAEIFQGLEPGGIALIPAESPFAGQLSAAALACQAEVRLFGRSDDAYVRALDTVPAEGGGTLVTAQIGARRLCYTVSAPGEHWVGNSLAVLGAVDAVGADLGAAGLALAELEGLAGRGARHRLATADGSALLIDESYNANPASMRVTIEQLGQEPASRRIVILGAMKELGEGSDAYHAGLSTPIRAANVDLAILVGDEMAVLAETLANGLEKPVQVAHVADAGAAEARLRDSQIRGGDAILVKGSNAVGLGAVVRALTGGEN